MLYKKTYIIMKLQIVTFKLKFSTYFEILKLFLYSYSIFVNLKYCIQKNSDVLYDIYCKNN